MIQLILIITAVVLTVVMGSLQLLFVYVRRQAAKPVTAETKEFYRRVELAKRKL